MKKPRLFIWGLGSGRQGLIRTASFIPVQIKIALNEAIPIYQKLAPKIQALKVLGISNEEIAKNLKINRKTIGKGFLYRAKASSPLKSPL